MRVFLFFDFENCLLTVNYCPLQAISAMETKKKNQTSQMIVLALPNQTELNSLLPVAKAAEACQFTRFGLDKHIKRGNLPVVLVGTANAQHVRPRDLALWLKGWLQTDQARISAKEPAPWLMELVRQIPDTEDTTFAHLKKGVDTSQR